METNWNYAELSKAAKAAGGPEKYVETLALASKNKGRMEMLPWLVVTSLITIVVIKVVDYFKLKKEINQEAIETAKKEIVTGIKEYDNEHDKMVNYEKK